jgi:poly-gamma-glutamate system protein
LSNKIVIALPPFALRFSSFSFLAFQLFSFSAAFASRHPAHVAMTDAAQCMVNSERVLFAAKQTQGLIADSLDINQTGLIGEEYSDITSTLGSLTAKRTSTNPDFAAYIVRQLVDHNIRRGDTVLVAMTGSFPGLNVATLCALDALDVEAYVMCSLAASSYGANQENFTWLHMEDLLIRHKFLTQRSDAITLGASGDVGGGLSEAGKSALRQVAIDLGYEMTEQPTSNQQKRARQKLRGEPHDYDLFINIGGNQIVLGTRGRDLPGGWIDPANTSAWRKLAHSSSGMIFDFLRKDVPVLNLLHVESIAENAGLPIDPVTFPETGAAPIYFIGSPEE